MAFGAGLIDSRISYERDNEKCLHPFYGSAHAALEIAIVVVVAVAAAVPVTGRAARMRGKQRNSSTAVSAVLTDGRAAWARRRVRKKTLPRNP